MQSPAFVRAARAAALALALFALCGGRAVAGERRRAATDRGRGFGKGQLGIVGMQPGTVRIATSGIEQ